MNSSNTTNNMDREWQDKGRPQSTLAQSFSAELNDLFQINSGIDNLSNQVFSKKQEVSSQSAELSALEARLRETERRLKKASSVNTSRTDTQRKDGAQPGTSSADAARAAIRPGPAKSASYSSDQSPQSRRQTQDGRNLGHLSTGSPSRISAGSSREHLPQHEYGREYVMVDRPAPSR